MAKKPLPTKTADVQPKAPEKSAPSQPWAGAAAKTANAAPDANEAPEHPAPADDAQNPANNGDDDGKNENPEVNDAQQGDNEPDANEDLPEEEIETRKLVDSFSEDELAEFQQELKVSVAKIAKRIVQLRVARSLTANMVSGNQHFGTKARLKTSE